VITLEDLRRICPHIRQPDGWAAALGAAASEFEIDAPRRAAAWIAQCAHESAEFNVVVENLNYGAAGLLNTFGIHFTAQEAQSYAHHPERIANRAYANRLGNGDEASGDGWLFRGRGPIQATGRDLYELLRADLGIDCVAHPELLESPEHGARAAGHFWRAKGLNQLADAMKFSLITRGVNGMYRWNREGDLDRAGYYEAACAVFGLTNSENVA